MKPSESKPRLRSDRNSGHQLSLFSKDPSETVPTLNPVRSNPTPLGIPTSAVNLGPDLKSGGRTVNRGFDLLRLAGLRRMIRSWWFPYAFQVLILIGFVGLALLGWGRYAPEGVAAKLYAKTNLINLLIWGLWWPAMVWAAVWLGRVWCLVCPLELVSNVGERLGRTFGLSARRLPRWIATGGLIALFYLAIQMCVAGASLHRVPAFTSAFLWILLGLALLTGLLLKDRAFCRGFCPVGLLLNVYGRGGMVAVRSKASQPCRDCTGRECKAGHNRYQRDARSCPSLLNPSTLNTNKDCLVCTQCFKACRPDNLALALRRPFSAADDREPLASWPIVLFVMVVSGFVTYEMFSEWKAAQALFLTPPSLAAKWLGYPALVGWIKGCWTLLVVPALLWLALGGLTRLLGGAKTLGEAWQRLVLPMAVVISAGHMAKGLAKMASWGGYLPHAIHEPLGIQTSAQLTAKTLAVPSALLSLSTVSAVGTLLLLTAVFFAIREGRLADRTGYGIRSVPVGLMGMGYLILVMGWGIQGTH